MNTQAQRIADAFKRNGYAVEILDGYGIDATKEDEDGNGHSILLDNIEEDDEGALRFGWTITPEHDKDAEPDYIDGHAETLEGLAFELTFEGYPFTA